MLSTQSILNNSINDGAFQGYAYSYPHKTAYRKFDPPLALDELWKNDSKEALFLYTHIPFCEMRCGFCNLFTTTNPDQDLVSRYLDSLERETKIMGDIIGTHSFGKAAVGGGTPTFLSMHETERLFNIFGQLEGFQKGVPMSYEVSPATIDRAKAELLTDLGVTRISMGVQSFILEETKAMGRPQKLNQVISAIENIKHASPNTMNLDLIYGAHNQTVESWLYSLKRTLEFEPEELFLYPLYIRPLTGLGRKDFSELDNRIELYRAGRDYLEANGYQQVSMRMFQKASHQAARNLHGPEYCCQQDGMLGLGAGARSYTSATHYSSDYAVNRKSIVEIINNYCSSDDESMAFAHYGVELDSEEQMRRHLIKSLLHMPGLSVSETVELYGYSPLELMPSLRELEELELATVTDDSIILTSKGLEYSDVIGPWMGSPKVRQRMEDYLVK